jgi:hypothetical protein
MECVGGTIGGGGGERSGPPRPLIPRRAGLGAQATGARFAADAPGMAVLDALPALPRDPDAPQHPFCKAMRVYKAAQAPHPPFVLSGHAASLTPY